MIVISVLRIIELQNEIWDLEKKAINGTTTNRLKGWSMNTFECLFSISQLKDNVSFICKKFILSLFASELQAQVDGYIREMNDSGDNTQRSESDINGKNSLKS